MTVSLLEGSIVATSFPGTGQAAGSEGMCRLTVTKAN